MLYLALVHSPYPHARIKNIDKTAALAMPGVKAVITGEGSRRRRSSAGSRRSTATTSRWCSPSAKCCIQYQEVAGVIATSRETALDAAELVDVEYEPLDPRRRSVRSARLDKTILRDDRENKTNHIYHWEVGAREATDAALAASDVRHQGTHSLPALPSGAARTVRRRRRHEPATGRLTIYLTSQAPHAHRTAVSLVTGIPEDKIHVISPDIGGGFGNKVPVYPGYVVATVASVDARRSREVGRDAHRKPDDHRLRARLPHGRRDRRHQRGQA